MSPRKLELSTIIERVLLVDDDPDVLDMTRRHLIGFGLQVDLAVNGKVAVELLCQQEYGLVVTDIAMPEMDGMELLLYIKDHFPQLDVLAISGYHELYNFTDLVAAGATDFMSKPYQRDELKAKLQRIFRERLQRMELAHNEEKEKTFFLHIVESLAVALDGKDKYTHGHSKRVTELSIQLAQCVSPENIDFELLRICGVLHDIGKIGVPDKILGKPGRLTAEEFDVIKQHPEQGAQILRPMESDRRVATISKIIKHHHERYDGKGYPDGLAGEDIPYLSRIIAIADSFDAMTSDRPYRKGMSSAIAVQQIRDNSGSQFDPLLAEKFTTLVEEGVVTDV